MGEGCTKASLRVHQAFNGVILSGASVSKVIGQLGRWIFPVGIEKEGILQPEKRHYIRVRLDIKIPHSRMTKIWWETLVTCL